METRKTPLQPNTFYHIYNRGINGQNIFLEERNYTYFLQKMSQYVSPFIEVYAYCLLRNHFHLLVRTKSEEELQLHIHPLPMPPLEEKVSSKSTSWLLSNSFASFFKSYAQAINKHYGRTGGFFEEPFRRIEVKNDAYFSQLIWYIHHNPQKHGFVDNFREYPHSSYQSHLQQKTTNLKRSEVLNWFGNAKEYIAYHAIQSSEDNIKDLLIEYD